VDVAVVQTAGLAAVVILLAAALLVVFLLASAVRIVQEYERGVIFRLGRVQGTAKGPGLFFLIPIVDRMVKIDLRTVTMDVPPQDVITRDNVPARVNAVVYFRVMDPNKSVIEIENHVLATSQMSQTTLRSVLGQKDLDDLLTNREAINEELQTIIDEQTDPWGVKVSAVEVKDVEIPRQMQRAMARQAESERERRAKVIAAEGEYQASQRLRQAADRLESPTALQLRLFQTLNEISSEQNSTIVLPVPIDLFRPYLDAHGTDGSSSSRPAQVRRREEREAERRYEETVGQARSEQKAMRELAPDETIPHISPTLEEDVVPPRTGEEEVLPRTQEEALSPGQERSGQMERGREEDKGLIEKARDTLVSEEEPRRTTEGADIPPERR
jgi:regulator of protease activity HflC (stomatin/prohibitin superfamily)